MNKLVVDDVLRSRLNGLTASVELCDESGQVVAFVVPAPPIASNGEAVLTALQAECHRLRQEIVTLKRQQAEMLVAWSRERTSDEELDRRRQEPGGQSLEGVLRHLEAP